MWSLLLCAALSSAPSGAVSLEQVAAALKGAKAWRVSFAQRYVPAGFDAGATDRGTLVIAPPERLRFDYEGEAPRVFAFDGSVARMVDSAAGTCDAMNLDRTSWNRLPIATLLDPGATRAAFAMTIAGRTLRLVPREPIPELAAIEADIAADGLPALLVVRDAVGNRNEFTFSGWQRRDEPADSLFQPSLPGAAPCRPGGG